MRRSWFCILSAYASCKQFPTQLLHVYASNDSDIYALHEKPKILHDSLVSGRLERAESRCVLLNARSIKNKLDEFQTEIIVGQNYPCVVGVTETWLDNSIPNNIFQCKNEYDVFRKDRNLNGGGVAILSKKHLRATELTSEVFQDLELIAIQTKFKKEIVIFACFYRSSVQQYEILPQLTLAVEYLASKGKPLVLFGDFNLPGIKWGDIPVADVSNKQNEFLDIFQENGLHQKVLSSTRFDAILDLVFINEPALIDHVEVGPPLSSTCDHNVLAFNLGLKTLGDDSEPVKLRLWFKADIVGIGLSLEKQNWPLFFQNCRNVDDMWVSFRLFCYDLFEKFVPTVIRRKNRKFKYPNNIINLLKRKKTAFKNRLISAHHRCVYKRVSKLCSAAIRNFHRDRDA